MHVYEESFSNLSTTTTIDTVVWNDGAIVVSDVTAGEVGTTRHRWQGLSEWNRHIIGAGALNKRLRNEIPLFVPCSRFSIRHLQQPESVANLPLALASSR